MWIWTNVLKKLMSRALGDGAVNGYPQKLRTQRINKIRSRLDCKWCMRSMLCNERVRALRISQRGMADRSLFKRLTYSEGITLEQRIDYVLGEGFELAIVVEILLSVFCSKDWSVKRGGVSQTL